MPVKFRCSECTQKLRIDDAYIGRLVSCVRCGAKQRVPQESAAEFAAEAAPPPAPAPPSLPPTRPAPQPVEFHPAAPAGDQPGDDEPAAPPESPRRRPFPGFAAHREPEFSPPAASIQPTLQPPPDEAAPDDAPPDDAAPQDSAPDDDSADDASGPPAWEQPHAPYATDTATADAADSPAHAESSLVPPMKKLDVEEMIDMTAMVDIVFFLLIFFLVTSMHTLDSTIPMPAQEPQKGTAKEPATVAAIDADDNYIVVRIDRNDRITVEGAEVRSERDLLFKLRDLRLAPSRPDKLLVVGHGDATHGTAVMIMDAGRELGMDQVKLTVKDEEE